MILKYFNPTKEKSIHCKGNKRILIYSDLYLVEDEKKQ